MRRTEHRHETTVGDLRRLSVTLSQAAHILDIDVRSLRKAVDRHLVTATFVTRGNKRVRKVNGLDVMALRLDKVLKSDVRDRYFKQMLDAPDRKMLTDVFRIDRSDEAGDIIPFLFDTAARTVADIRCLDEAARLIDKDGRICGADVEAHRIAALVSGGMSVDHVIEDYPNLDKAGVEAAVRYAAANPKPGRPFPTSTAKSILRDGEGGGLAEAFSASKDEK